jgi:hypothetical protein
MRIFKAVRSLPRIAATSFLLSALLMISLATELCTFIDATLGMFLFGIFIGGVAVLAVIELLSLTARQHFWGMAGFIVNLFSFIGIIGILISLWAPSGSELTWSIVQITVISCKLLCLISNFIIVRYRREKEADEETRP